MANKKKIIGISSAVILLIAVATFSFFYYGSFSDGFRAGIVMKISRKGYIFKTYEGQLDLGVQQKPWAFSVDASQTFEEDGKTKKVVEVLEQVAQTGERVKLRYEEKFAQFSWRGDTKYFVTEVERIDK